MSFSWLLDGLEERFESLQRRRHNAIADSQPVLVGADETRLLQDPQMLRDRGLREGQLVDDDAARSRFLARQHSKNAHANWMRRGFREYRELRVRSFAVQRT